MSPNLPLNVHIAFSKVPHEVLDLLQAKNLPNNYWKMLMFFLRQFFGYRKQEDTFYAVYIEQQTGIPQSSYGNMLETLKEQGVIISYHLANNSSLNSQYYILLNKDYKQWVLRIEY